MHIAEYLFLFVPRSCAAAERISAGYGQSAPFVPEGLPWTGRYDCSDLHRHRDTGRILAMTKVPSGPAANAMY